MTYVTPIANHLYYRYVIMVPNNPVMMLPLPHFVPEI